MTNHDRADRLVNEAREILQELHSALQRGVWNLAVRRAQEIVELSLKALLAELGVDYPKVHDVGPQFTATVGARRLDVDSETLTWLEATSSRLAALRAPAFYQEAHYDESEARDAAAAAERVVAFAQELIDRLRTR